MAAPGICGARLVRAGASPQKSPPRRTPGAIQGRQPAPPPYPSLFDVAQNPWFCSAWVYCTP